MNTFQLHSSTGKGKIAQVDFWAEKALLIVSVEDFNYPIEDANRQTTYHISTPTGGLLSKHYNKLFSYKNANGALKYAQKHGVEQYHKTNEPSPTIQTDSVSDAHIGSDSASVTPCPVPAPAPAKSAAKGQGILSYIDTLKSIKAQIYELNKHSFENSLISDAENYSLLSIEMQLDELIAFDLSLLPDIAETTNFPDCPVCLEPCDRDQLAANGGACNFCYHELSNFSYEKSLDLERRSL